MIDPILAILITIFVIITCTIYCLEKFMVMYSAFVQYKETLLIGEKPSYIQ